MLVQRDRVHCILPNRWLKEVRICTVHEERPLYRGYYMAARGYKFYLRVLKVSLTSERSERVRDTFSTRR